MNGFLIDENLPAHLLPTTQWPVFHARELGSSLTDTQLWRLAAQNEWAIVSKDADFTERIVVATLPPWIVHRRIGNVRRTEFKSMIVHLWPQRETFIPARKLINVYRERIEAVSDR